MTDLLATQPKQMRKLWRNVTGERLWYALHGYDVSAQKSKRGMFGHGRVLPPGLRSAARPAATRRVLSWRLSNTQDADFCVEALNEAISRFGPPKIFNTDQGSQFTSFKWINTLSKAGIKISMPLGDFANHLPVIDGKGQFMDNIFPSHRLLANDCRAVIERLWRSLKYECVYLHAWSGGREARTGIGKWITFYNTQRPHKVHKGLTPDAAYWTNRHQQETDQAMQRVA